MKNVKYYLTVLLALVTAGIASAQDPNAKPPTAEEMAEAQADKFSTLLDLEYYQVFLIDSVMVHDFQAMMDEIAEVQKSGASNQESFMVVSDKWMDAVDKAFEKIFTPEQWQKYLKSGYGKEKRKRDKRMAERVPVNKIE
jgi:hypothetical protein